jgi:hypothetical protein
VKFASFHPGWLLAVCTPYRLAIQKRLIVTSS